jgi:hypothetical protein
LRSTLHRDYGGLIEGMGGFGRRRAGRGPEFWKGEYAGLIGTE